jgi:hypothetical protein
MDSRSALVGGIILIPFVTPPKRDEHGPIPEGPYKFVTRQVVISGRKSGPALTILQVT